MSKESEAKSANIEESLVHAVQKQDITTATALLAQGASPNAPVKTDDGYCRTTTTALFAACESKNVALVKLLLDRGADPNIEYRMRSINEFEYSCCLIAASPSFEISRLLLGAGANPNGTITYGESDRFVRTALKVAEGNPELTKLLKEFGAK